MFEAELKDSKEKLKKLTDELPKKLPEAPSGTKNRVEKLDEVIKERDALKTSMEGVESLLAKLRSRADQADRMELEISNLKRELQRCSRGAAGDASPKQRVESACKQCRRYADELNQRESLLEAEIKRSNETEAEKNVLRQRVRSIDVMEAELIVYRTKFEEYECKLLKLKELMVQADMNDREIRELKCKLEETERLLKNCDLHCEDLIVSFLNYLQENFSSIISMSTETNREARNGFEGKRRLHRLHHSTTPAVSAVAEESYKLRTHTSGQGSDYRPPDEPRRRAIELQMWLRQLRVWKHVSNRIKMWPNDRVIIRRFSMFRNR